MSASYQAVTWNRQKFRYDGLLAGLVVAYLGLYVGVTLSRDPDATLETALIRALGTGALLLLGIILVIGPLARFDRRFLPLLYNRRHLGVTMALLALAHAVFSVIQFHALGNLNPVVSLLTGSADARHVGTFPFELPGLAALAILLLMAATSHDFWLAVLGPPVWKALHMLVYAAFGLVVAHVALGGLQQSGSPFPAILLMLGTATVFGLQIAAGRRERPLDEAERTAEGDGWVDVCAVEEIAELRAKMATVGGERIAVFRYAGRISCVSNVCRHQNGPLGEGKIVDGCITCPWHGYQYLPDTGQSPPPFTEQIATYSVQVRQGRVFVDPRAHPPGTRVEPARFADAVVAVGADGASDPFYVGYHPAAPAVLARGVRRIVIGLGAIALASGVALAATQDRADPGVFEYGQLRTLHGQIREFPYPALLVPGNGVTGRAAAYTRYLLVAEGKHGAQGLTAGRDGQWADLRGTRIARGGQEMLELVEAGVTITPPAQDSQSGATATPAPVSLGRVVLRGEVVDGKCWLGVMKPATGGVHRGCAARCVSGGIPPLLMTRDSAGVVRHYLLADGTGRPASAWFAEFVGRRVELTGELIQDADLPVLRVTRTVVVW